MMGARKHGRTAAIVHTVQLLDWSYEREARQAAGQSEAEKGE
jgi:glycolate oxidase iron-sulfur subunit